MGKKKNKKKPKGLASIFSFWNIEITDVFIDIYKHLAEIMQLSVLIE